VTPAVPDPAGELIPAEEPTPAAWVVDRLRTFGVNVASLVPDVVPAYGRVLHPGYHEEDRGLAAVSSAEIASIKGTVVHPEVRFENLVGRSRIHGSREHKLWDIEPAEGTLPADIGVKLAAVLARYTSTPEHCWFGVWSGWAGRDDRAATAPKDLRQNY